MKNKWLIKVFKIISILIFGTTFVISLVNINTTKKLKENYQIQLSNIKEMKENEKVNEEDCECVAEISSNSIQSDNNGDNGDKTPSIFQKVSGKICQMYDVYSKFVIKETRWIIREFSTGWKQAFWASSIIKTPIM